MSVDEMLLSAGRRGPSVRLDRCLVADEVLLGISTTVDTGSRPSTAYLVLAGDLCPATAPKLASVLRGLESEGVASIHVDLSRVIFCTSHGAEVLDDARRRIEDRAGSFQLVGAHGVVHRVLEVLSIQVDGTSGPDAYDRPPSVRSAPTL